MVKIQCKFLIYEFLTTCFILREKGRDTRMPYSFMKNKKKVPSSYKTLYLSNTLIDKVNQIAEEHQTSFNNVVVSMIEYCLNSETDGGT